MILKATADLPAVEKGISICMIKMIESFCTHIYLKTHLLTVVFFIPFCLSTATAQPGLSAVRKQLGSPYFEKLYSKTYYSLLDRIAPNGFLQESITGDYEGMYCRTTGPMVLLLLETGRLKEAESIIKCVLDATSGHDMERIPHVIVMKNNKSEILSDENQIDGQAHVLLAWARLALNRGRTPFEDQTWPQVKAIMRRTCDRTYFQHGWWSVEPGLIRNLSFEHSREGRRWDVWDLLTQSFVGAALKDMIPLARRQGEESLALAWQKKLTILQEGIRKNLSTVRNGDTTYLEMRLPDSNGGTPYMGMGWVTLSPVAAGWEGMPHDVMQNTFKAMSATMVKQTDGIFWLPTDSYPDGAVSNEIIGKGIAWELEYARREGDFQNISGILKLIEVANNSMPLYMEGAWLDGAGLKRSAKINNADLEGKTNLTWKIKDAGNGEQCAWWCWAMARLRKDAQLPVEPKRIP
jgi:hypothetical protein